MDILKLIIKKSSDYLKHYGIINYISNNYDYFISQVDTNIYLSNLPRDTHLNQILLYDFDVILSIMKKDETGTKEISWIKHTNIKHHFIEAIDYTAPSKENYEEFLSLIQQYENKKILIHCYAGKGRSNCMAARYLMYKKNITSSEAIHEIIKLNPRSNMSYSQKKSI